MNPFSKMFESLFGTDDSAESQAKPKKPKAHHNDHLMRPIGARARRRQRDADANRNSSRFYHNQKVQKREAKRFAESAAVRYVTDWQKQNGPWYMKPEIVSEVSRKMHARTGGAATHLAPLYTEIQAALEEIQPLQVADREVTR